MKHFLDVLMVSCITVLAVILLMLIPNCAVAKAVDNEIVFADLIHQRIVDHVDHENHKR